MKKIPLNKSKIYIFIPIFLVVLLFSTAALCNSCGLQGSTAKTDITETTETAANETTKEANGTTKEASETTEETKENNENSNDSNDSEKSKPTIALTIYEGPTFDEDSGFCYYRIEAKVTGNPAPKVEFSKDDSNGAWGSKKVQVNIHNPGDTYTLTATATNSEGSDDDSITLEWGCNGAEPDPEPEPDPGPEIAVEEITINADAGKSGYISDGTVQLVFPGTWVYMGDNTLNKEFKGYLTFSLAGLLDMADVIVTEVKITIPGVVFSNEPWNAGGQIVVKVKDYGNTIDYPEDFQVGGIQVKTFNATNTINNLDFSTAKLKEELQGAISLGKELFQLKFGLSGVSSNGIADWYKFPAGNAKIYVKYERIVNAM